MKNQPVLIVSAALALALAGAYALRITTQRHDFDATVQQALGTTAGYDRAFIGMVDQLEKELATRARFGYEGGKDPMTGRLRQVVRSVPANHGPAKTADTVQSDPIKLSAIIFDDSDRRYTAIVMDGERSFSVEVGDKLRNRVIRAITETTIVLEGDSLLYKYDVFGNREMKRK